MASLGAPNGPHMSPVARHTKNISLEQFLLFPNTTSPSPKSQGTVEPCVLQPHWWTGDFLGLPNSLEEHQVCFLVCGSIQMTAFDCDNHHLIF